MKNFISIAILSFFLQSTNAQSITWTGAGDGINWSDKNNWSTGFLPNPADSVIINNAPNVVMNVTGDMKCLLLTNTHFTINSSVGLTLLEGDPFENEMNLDSSTLINNGSISIESGGLAIKIKPGSVLKNMNELDISVAQFHGIENFGILENSGSISISNTGENGIFNRDSVYNSPDGMIIINTIQNVGVYSNYALVNDGMIDISQCDGSGITIANNGRFKNSNRLHIDEVGSHGISSSGKFENGLNSLLEISNTTGSFDHGIFTTGSSIFTNEGTIKISAASSTGIYNTGSFSNSDSIILMNAGRHGIQSTDSLFNSSTGVIQIFNPNNKGIDNSGDLVNLGRISIDQTGESGIYNTHSFSNSGTLDISANQIYGIYNEDTLFNAESGIIIIDSVYGSLSSGIRNHLTTSKVHNFGMITIKNIENDGLFNQGLFVNNNTIVVNNTNSSGLVNSGLGQNNIGARLYISAINDTHARGIRNYPNRTFLNEGFIQIDSINGSFSEGFRNEGIFINQDSLIVSAIGKIGIVNYDSLQNGDNAVIEISDIYRLSSTAINNFDAASKLINDGIINVSMTNNDGITNNGEFFISTTGFCSTQSILGDPLTVTLGAVLDCLGIMDIQN